MLKIYICEDNREQREFLEDIAKKFVMMEDGDIQFGLATDNPKKLLGNIDENEVGVYFLDIDLGCDITGLTLAQEIRKIDKRGFIIFVTTHSEMAYMTFTYKVEAMDFITKGDPEVILSKVQQCIKEAYNRYCSPNYTDSKVFKFNVGDKEYCMHMNDIVFIETSEVPHKLVLHGTKSILEFQGSMKKVFSSLDDNFAMIHRCFIINKDHVKEIDIKERTVTMDDDSVCFASLKKLRGLCSEIL